MKRNDDYWRRAPYKFYDPRPKPLPWYKKAPAWLWVVSATILAGVAARLVL